MSNKKRIELLESRVVFGFKLDSGSIIELPFSIADDLVEKGKATDTKKAVCFLVNGKKCRLDDNGNLEEIKENKLAKQKKASKKVKESDGASEEA